MESIEMITAQEKEVTIKDPKSGKNQIVIVKVWIVKTRDGRDGKIYESTQALQREKKTKMLPLREFSVKPIYNFISYYCSV